MQNHCMAGTSTINCSGFTWSNPIPSPEIHPPVPDSPQPAMSYTVPFLDRVIPCCAVRLTPHDLVTRRTGHDIASLVYLGWYLRLQDCILYQPASTLDQPTFPFHLWHEVVPFPQLYATRQSLPPAGLPSIVRINICICRDSLCSCFSSSPKALYVSRDAWILPFV
ncbi:hypothetical protein BGW80DRAFT_153583 [Lactifluus volemus]|nr:hypothetical protein BGW80DRAFT_153583 [Lactifluus volemus]